MLPTLACCFATLLLAEDPRPYLGPADVLPPVPPAKAATPEPEPTPEPTPTKPAPSVPPEVPKKSKKDDPFGDKVRVHGRLLSGFQYDIDRPPPNAQGTPQPEDADFRFFLRQARVMVEAKVGDYLRLRLGADLADAIEPPPGGQIPYLRNAYGDIRVAKKALRVRFGYFKRPFSRLELLSVGTLPFRGRGLGNRLMIEDRRFGTRALGTMLWGEVLADRLAWYASLSTPDLQGGGVDAHGRLEVQALSWLGIGGGGAYKHVSNPLGGAKLHLAAATGDLYVRIKGLEALVESVAAQNANLPHHPFSLSFVGFAAYTVPLGRGFGLQPTVLAEWVDADIEYKESEAARVIGGLNVLWRDWLRILPQVELIRPLGAASYRNPWVEGETYYLMLALQI